MGRMPRSFYARPAMTVARDLLGKTLVRILPEAILKGRIVETEAYAGPTDPGSHAFRGPTPRTLVMFGPPGHLYVYVSYGLHVCMNIVTDVEGTAGAVLLRAVEPLEGVDAMRQNRGLKALESLCNGPGKLCQAFSISRSDNGSDLQTSPDIWVEEQSGHQQNIGVSSRIGLSAGRNLQARFFILDSPFVSPGKPSM